VVGRLLNEFIVLSLYHCIISLPLYYLFTIVLSLYHCIVSLLLYYLFTIVLSLYHCIISLPLYCLFTIVLSLYHCIILTILGVCNEIVGDKEAAYYCYDTALQCEDIICSTAAERKVNLHMT
jgi:hypothetical protein